MFNSIELARKIGYLQTQPVSFGSTKYQYVTLKTIYEKVLPILLADGYDVEEGVNCEDGFHRAFLKFTDQDGETFTHYGIPCKLDFTEYNTKTNLPAFKQTVQNVGALRSYLIRYAWNDLLHIADYDLEKMVEAEEKRKDITNKASEAIRKGIEACLTYITEDELEERLDKSISSIDMRDLTQLRAIYKELNDKELIKGEKNDK